MSDALTIARVRVENIRGIEALEVEPGHLTTITGRTGAGKSSVIEALRAVMRGRVDRPALVREGAEKGSVILELSDGSEVSRTFKPGGGTLPARVSREGMTSTNVQTYLTGLFSPYSFDPVRFLQLEPAEQARELLSLLDVQVTDEEYIALSGGTHLPGVDYSALPIEVCATIERALYESRTEVGRERKREETLEAEARSKIQVGFDAEAVREVSLRDVVDRLNAMREANAEVGRQKEARRANDHERAVGATKIDALQAQLAELEAQQEERELERNRLDDWLVENPEQDTSDLDAQVAQWEEQRATLAQHDEAQAAADRATAASARYDELTALIEAARARPSEWLARSEMPVEGLAVDPETGTLTVGGRALEAYSDGERILLAIQIAKATSGDLRVLLLDDLEKLDPETREAMLEAARADNDVQWIAAWAAPGELEITVVGDAEIVEG
jgi:energy-coupling factor transporter ATP-binding protein EcfA2